jgi:integrase
MTIHFYLDKKSKNPEKLIMCYIRGIRTGETITISTGQRIEEKHWNKESEKSIAKGTNKYVGAPELNSYLISYKEAIKRVYNTVKAENPFVEYEEIKEAILRKLKPDQYKTAFFDVYETYLAAKKNEWAESSYNKFQDLRAVLQEFEEYANMKVEFSKIDLLFYDKLLAFFYDKKEYTNNTVHRYVGLLKMFLNWATERNLNNNTEYKKFKAKENDTEVIFLTSDELDTLQNLDLSENEKLEKVRDTFCFGCYTGARYSDIAKIQHEEIRDNTWHFRAKKTKDLLKVPLNIKAQRILEKYKNSSQPLPIISNQKMNKYLKDLCKLAGIDEPIKKVRYKGSKPIEESAPKYSFISTHTARRTFITVSLQKGMRPETVQATTGHHDYKMMEKYIKVSSDMKEAEMKKFWDNESELKLVSGEVK